MKSYGIVSLSLVSALALHAHPAAADTLKVDLGSVDRVTALFSYPNCQTQCPTPAPTLPDTVAHYLQQSVVRDGYPSATVSVTQEGTEVYANLTGVDSTYGQAIQSFLAAGDLGYAGANNIKQAGLWQSDWYFFLPLGLAMQNHPTVELLHFPPDSVMFKTQDYLNNPTTNRWASLLVANGVQASQTDAYQTIVDIAPIAAPSNAGSSFTGIYSYFTPYIQSLLGSWTSNPPATQAGKPMVAFGAPAREWVVNQYKLSSLDVLQLGSIPVTPGQPEIPILGSNHPSYIWYASDPKNYGGDMNKANAAGFTVMEQDLTAACWQAQMGQAPASDPNQTLSQCQTTWMKTQVLQACEMFFESIRNMTQAEAFAECVIIPPNLPNLPQSPAL